MTDMTDINGAPMGCERFEDLLPDYLERELPPADQATAEAHRLACPECAALAGDLEGIRDSAAVLPVLEPSRDLWAGIETRIAASVVPLDDARAAIATRDAAATPLAIGGGGLSGGMRRPWLAAAAALLLVAGTAGVTYTITASRLTRDTGSADRLAAAVPVGAPFTLPPVVAPATSEDRGTDSEIVPAAPAPREAAPAPTRSAAPPIGRLASERAPATGSAVDAAAAIYDAEIAILRGMLDQRGGTLDSSTVRVLETNLGIIDRAIRESREALMRDPASPLLNQQLTDALGEKLDLMRTAVLMSRGTD